VSAPNPKHLLAVERWTMILAALAIVASAVALPRATAFGVTLGAGLMVVNAYAIRRIGTRVLRTFSRPGIAILLLNLKMLALIALVYLAIRFLHVDAIGFIIGISVFPVAVVIAAVRVGLAESTSEEEPTHG
jgi:hypothetical protein